MESPVKWKARQANPPDGGYGWFVLLAAFLMYGLVFGIIKSFGVFYVQICLYFSSTATEMSWVTSTTVTTIYVAGIFKLITTSLQFLGLCLLEKTLLRMGAVSGVIATFGFFAPILYLVPYAQSQGIEKYQAAALMSISAAFDFGSRLICGWVANLRLMKHINLLMMMRVLHGVSLLLCPLATSFAQLAAFSAVYGLTFGGTISMYVTVLTDIVGVAKMGSAFGISMLFRSIGGLLRPSVAGIFIDKTSNYGISFVVAGVALIVSAIFLMPIRTEKPALKLSDHSKDAERDKPNGH